MPLKVVYFFQNTSDPDRCSGNLCMFMEGWYDDRPPRPHNGRCNCPIHLYAGWADHVYKNFREIGGGEMTREATRRTGYQNPHPTEEIEASVEMTFTIKRTAKVEVAEIMEHFSVSVEGEVTETITRSLPVRIPPRHEAVVTARISGITTFYAAERWAVFKVISHGLGAGGGVPDSGDIYIEDVHGGTLYEESANVDFEVELSPL